MKYNSKTQLILMVSTLVCLLGFSSASQAVRFSGSCPIGHDMEDMSGKKHIVSKGLAEKECSSCHGADGNGVNASNDVPNLAGQDFMYMCAWLDECRKQGKKCEGHEDIAAKFSNQDIVGLAMFYSHLPSSKW